MAKLEPKPVPAPLPPPKAYAPPHGTAKQRSARVIDVRMKRLILILVATAVLSSCAGESNLTLRGPGTVDQAYTRSAADAAAECRALKSVRDQYPLVEPSGGLEAHLKRCGLLYNGGGLATRQTLFGPPARGPEEVRIERRGDTYYVPVRVNDTITLPFLLDTGAGDLVIPADVALTLIRAGALRSGDFIGKRPYQLANGSEEVSDIVVIREVRVGDHVVRNVTASITALEGKPLLGQSFLSKFGTVTVDYKRLVLILSP